MNIYHLKEQKILQHIINLLHNSFVKEMEDI